MKAQRGPIIAAAALLAGVALTACAPPAPPRDAATAGATATSSETTGATANPTTTATKASPMTESATSLGVIDIKTGTGAEAKPGQKVSVHYTGWLFDAAAPENKGRKFDSSRDHGEAFEFNLGLGEVIRGWDQGVAGMKIGGQRRLIVPANLGYGAAGAGGVIPGGATLIFDVELLAIR